MSTFRLYASTWPTKPITSLYAALKNQNYLKEKENKIVRIHFRSQKLFLDVSLKTGRSLIAS